MKTRVVTLFAMSVVLMASSTYPAQGIVHIYTDYNTPTLGPCGARPVYLRNTTNSTRRVTVKVTEPPAMTRCRPRVTEEKEVSVPANDEVFLGYNQVNCSSSAFSVACGEVSYRL